MSDNQSLPCPSCGSSLISDGEVLLEGDGSGSSDGCGDSYGYGSGDGSGDGYGSGGGEGPIEEQKTWRIRAAALLARLHSLLGEWT